jgi:hypothetical protein
MVAVIASHSLLVRVARLAIVMQAAGQALAGRFILYLDGIGRGEKVEQGA